MYFYKPWEKNHCSMNTVIHSSTLGIQRKVTKLPRFWCLVFRTQFQNFLVFFLSIFFAVQLPIVSMVTITLAENKDIPHPRRAGAHPRRAGAILWDAAAIWPAVIFVAVAPTHRSPKLSVSWLTLYGLVDRLPVSASNLGWALQRHFLVDFQTQDFAGKIFSCSKRVYFVFVNRSRNGWTASSRSLPTHRFRDWSKTETALQRQRHCSVIFWSISKTKMSLERSFPALNENVCFCESNEKRRNSVRSKFADASSSRLIEDRGRPKVQPSYRLSKVRETGAVLETLTWRKHATKCSSWKRFFFSFQRGKGREKSKLCMCCLKNHTQYLYTMVTYDTPNPRKN